MDCMFLGLHALLGTLKPKGSGWYSPTMSTLRLDRGSCPPARPPSSRVDQQPAGSLALRSVAAPIVVVKTRPVLPACRCNVLIQATGIIGSFFLPVDRLVGRFHPLEHLAEHQRLAVAGQGEMDVVDVGRSPDVAVLDAAEDRMALRPGAMMPRVLCLPWSP